MQLHTPPLPANAGHDNGVRFASCDRATALMRARSNVRVIGPIAAISVAALLLAFSAAGVHAQNAAQDAINQNLLLRQQQEQDVQNRMDDAARNVEPGVLAQPSADAAVSLPPAQLPPARLPPADLQSQQLYQSQQQQMLGQQIQNRSLPVPVQEQQNQIQLLQFQREDQAQHLNEEIQRDSSRAVHGVH